MTPFHRSNRLLLVEDDPSVRRSLAETLVEEGFAVSTAASGEEALQRMAEAAPDVVLSDVRMPGLDGVELLTLLRERASDVDVILMTAYHDMPTVARAMREGAFDFLVKPLELDALREVLQRVVADRRLRRRTPPRKGEEYRLDQLVGHDPRMIGIYKVVGQLAANRVSALLRGETGTGKGMVARAIHYNSPQADQPFVAVNCTALPETLLESELFGHVKGAFTGAVAERRGRFAVAGRGTIFLDEVGDTSLELQAKLLRVLEDREFHPVGSDRAVRTEARVVAATHRDLEQRVREGTFREDLYYRLRVVEIRIPPLRERPADIPLLARHFVTKAAHDLGRREPEIADEVMQALLWHVWPGNVRELENCLKRAVVLSTGSVLRVEHLGLAVAAETAPFPTLEQVEAEHLRRALAAAEGNKARAAELLGISRPRLYRMLDKHGG